MSSLPTQNNDPVVSPSDTFLADVLAGLSQPQKQLSPKYFYDARGSHLFDQICQLDEYYPYACEMTMLPTVAESLADRFRQPVEVIEFGAGSLHKVKPLLDKISAISRFIAIDISGDHLALASTNLKARYPHLEVTAVEGDFTEALRLPASDDKRMGFFPGSTIGNFSPADATHFLQNAGQTLGQGQYMLLGVDTKKPNDVLQMAYNDSKGVTAAFNKNLLVRINRELDANFQLDQFEHRAFYNSDLGRVEMHLVATREQRVDVAGREINFADGETIHTENSYKYHQNEFESLLEKAGWQAVEWWHAPDKMFSVVLAQN
ncbi:L-histidine N(alpha)-methyltransferase [Aliidiomarina soli]|uniref:L-histidine N(Alpha)-methyltransferase n=1 Tax=Aliidiomarina soli TaxID=1928574 RepID=A0A432WHJ9_9GAMM|nr:L-histidine N(alpha)-methyltransferase [Aliidiomarina soli]RUO33201.1 L-histidine N(alpha)-methyltransferase [Aliidiomarina soli]